jgi:hypothetical protein
MGFLLEEIVAFGFRRFTGKHIRGFLTFDYPTLIYGLILTFLGKIWALFSEDLVDWTKKIDYHFSFCMV